MLAADAPPPLPLPFPKLRSCCSAETALRAATWQFRDSKSEESRENDIIQILLLELETSLSLNRDLVESVGVLGVFFGRFCVMRAGPDGETRTADRVDTSRAPDHRANRFQLLRGEKRRRQTLPGRLELPTLRLTASRSSQLS